MARNPKIVNEIVENASAIPLEFQKYILDIGKAMAFTRKVMQTKQNLGEKEKNHVQKETA